MATSIAADKPSLPHAEAEAANDPFVSSTSGPTHHRFSNFDHQLFALGPASSPEQAKRALQAHLAETQRRLAEAGKLGTALVQQRKELTERLEDIEKIQAEGEITSDLREKLMDIEKEYNDVARETARAFLPKSRVPSNETAGGSPYVPEGRGGRRSVSPSKFESQATGSPTKLSVPNRKIRNQPANRIHDIEFAAEISTSLIAQVRNLQGLLAEKDEELRDVKTDKSKLEDEAERLEQRVKTLDESEHRYKDENWNLETQIHELIAKQSEAADREQKLTQSLSLLQKEKNDAQKDLDEVKLAHSKLAEEHNAVIKHHDIELGTAKRNIVLAEGERTALQRKVDELIGQNQELAKAFSAQRGRALDRDQTLGMSDEDFDTANDNITPEHSPPPSPVKGTPRHSMLESETLKTSLHHAQRTIQSQRSQLHREKTEKLELKRMLQDARDELEKSRNDSGGLNRRSRKVESKEFKKPAKLGGVRSARSEIFMDDPDWEDNQEDRSPTHLGPTTRRSGDLVQATDSSDHFETANETSDAAFETANERGTETEEFQTGAEEFSDSEDAQTETDSPLKGRSNRPQTLILAGNRQSFHSTASTSNDEEYDFGELKTPTAVQPQKMRLKVSRGLLNRRSRQASEEPTFQSSPASFATSSASGTPQQAGQSLFAELAEFEGSDDESISATPSRGRSVTPGSSAHTQSTPIPAVPALPKLIMVDSGIMTDPVKSDLETSLVETPTIAAPKPIMVDSGVMTDPLVETPLVSPVSVVHNERPVSMDSAVDASHTSAQWLSHEDVTDGGSSRPMSTLSYSEFGTQHDVDMDEKLARFPMPPSTPKKLFEPTPPVLSFSSIDAQDIEPLAEPEVPLPAPPTLSLTSIASQAVEPKAEPEVPAAPRPVFAFSSLQSEQVEPRASPERAPPSLTLSTFVAEHVEPISPPTPKRTLPSLTLSSVVAEDVEPISPPTPKQMLPALTLSSVVAEDVEPISPPTPKPVAPRFGFSSIESIETRPISPRSPKRDAFIIPRDMESSFAEKDQPRTPKPGLFGAVLGWGKGKDASSPVIAEDETRQSPRDTPQPETPESQRPFKEISTNSNVRPVRKQPVPTSDNSAQTSLTSDAIDEMLKKKAKAFDFGHEKSLSLGSSIGSPGTVRVRRSQESLGSPLGSPGGTRDKSTESALETTPYRRPGSANSARGSTQAFPPLPPNHKEVIEAARTGSAQGNQATTGLMGPPLWPASAMRNHRPRTPSGPKPQSPISVKGTPTPRAIKTGTGYGNADVHSPTKFSARSRQSSVSSFASEVDDRFNIRSNNMGMDATGFGPNTDPRMIQAITQTMIGEYLWKYTRKAGRGEMSENRHRRYFWIHPYTRTLYWSDRDPSTAGRAELRAKSVPIEAVRVVTDDNPMPPGLHRKSLVVISPGRTIKFTCTTGQRHETWFNALSYLLLRTTDEGHSDAEELAGNITREDVEEFNPSFGRRAANGTRPRPPPSLSSYNSRTTRNQSPAVGVSMGIPTLTPTPHKTAPQRPSIGTLGRLSGYWKNSQVLTGTFSSLRSRSANGQNPSIYEASEVHDSAEDLRHMIEKQDRESDRLENVRACCDGKHDVGVLAHGSKRGRVSHTHSHPGPSTATTPMSSTRTRA